MQKGLVKFESSRGQSGYDTALLVREPGEKLYSLYLPMEEVPSVFGSTESFDINILIAGVKGKIMGKQELEDVDVDVLLHRDNILRINSLVGQVLDFLVLYSDGTGYTFSATTQFRPNTASADVLRGTLTFSPLSANTVSVDVRDLVKQTVSFAQTIPDSLSFSSDAKATSQKVTVKITQPNAQYEITSNNSVFTVSEPDSDGVVTITCAGNQTKDQFGIIYIKASSTDKLAGSETESKYAPWTTTIAVSCIV